MHLRVPFGVRLGWGQILKRTLHETIADNCLGLAAQLAYFFFLSLFPGLLVIVALTGFFRSDLLERILTGLSFFVPPDILLIVQRHIEEIQQSGHAGLLTIGALGTLWSSSSAMTALIDTLNRAYGIKEARSWWKVQLLGICLTLTLAVFVLISFTLVIAGPEIAESIAAGVGLGPAFALTWKIVQWPVILLLISVAFGIVYYAAPDAEQLWRWIIPGSLVATLLWLLISLGFRFYVVNLGRYGETYGALGGVIVLLLWFYLSGLAVLIGAELNSELEHASPYGKAEGEKVAGEHRGWLFRVRRHGGIGETPQIEPMHPGGEGVGQVGQ